MLRCRLPGATMTTEARALLNLFPARSAVHPHPPLSNHSKLRRAGATGEADNLTELALLCSRGVGVSIVINLHGGKCSSAKMGRSIPPIRQFRGVITPNASDRDGSCSSSGGLLCHRNPSVIARSYLFQNSLREMVRDDWTCQAVARTLWAIAHPGGELHAYVDRSPELLNRQPARRH